MWVLSIGQNFPPPHPQRANDPNDALAVLINHRRAFILDNLIERATSKEPSMRPTMRDFTDGLKSWLTLANEPIVEPDVSNVTSEIRRLSVGFFESQSRLQRSRQEAELMTTALIEDLKGLGVTLSETGLQYNVPQRNGGNLRDGSGFARSNYGEQGVTVSMYTPSPTMHIYECGIMIQVLDERRHRLYAAHRIRPHDGKLQVIWSESHEVESGSIEEQQFLKQLVQGLCSNLGAGLDQFRRCMT
jgi:hypothetical protein